jgi:hypothetical protein
VKEKIKLIASLLTAFGIHLSRFPAVEATEQEVKENI